ncbi:anaerobic sulfatase maturase, partial [Desulfovibrio sp. OttesenSCG-928-I05]|nr:anaerobic sulfatase maturase [Desulfovibrio sp. OttesenSCG-928-I05]
AGCSVRMIPSFPLLIKPVGAWCTMRCAYCFYADKGSLHPRPQGVMDAALLEELVRSYLALPMARHTFVWQGGEPTLAGLPFFRSALALQKRYASPGAVIENCLQTNGILITSEWAAFCREENILTGISLDGPAAAHDRFRVMADGSGSHAAVLRGLDLLRHAGAEVNVLSLVTTATVKNPEALFEYLCGLGVQHQQYIPCVELGAAGRALPWTPTGKQWGHFLRGLYDAWAQRPVLDVSIRFFDSLLHRLLYDVPQLCHMGTDCRGYLVVERDGSLYPCDFFVDQRYRLGRVGETPWEDVRDSAPYARFGSRKAKLPDACRRCEFSSLCAGDCLKHRSPGNGKSWLCEGYKDFFRHTLPGFKRIARHLAAGKAPVPGSVARSSS